MALKQTKNTAHHKDDASQRQAAGDNTLSHRQPKPPGVRRSNAWLHTWAGLLMGWLLYMIFVTGSISFFKEELAIWGWPQAHFVDASSVSLDTAVATLEQQASQAERWIIDLPGDRNPTLAIRWSTDSDNKQGRNRQAVHFDPVSGYVIPAQDSRFFEFLYRLHFELYAVPRSTGRLIIGIATLLMLVTLISGIITHKKIFVDFFTFRPNKGMRSWLDLHNASGVLALPFHLIFTYSGLLLIMYLLMPWGATAFFDDDIRALNKAGGGKRGTVEKLQPSPSPITWDTTLPLATALEDINQQAQQLWPQGIDRIELRRRNDRTVRLTVYERGANTLLNRARGQRAHFNAKTGALQHIENPLDSTDAFRSFYNISTALHMQRYADTLQRILFFISGILGAVMVATGLVLWTIKRQTKSRSKKPVSRGFHLVESLNIAVITGLPIAIAVGMWANRLLPMDIASRAQWEINVFFLAWAACALHASIKTLKHRWAAQVFISAILLVSLALYDIFSLYTGSDIQVLMQQQSLSLLPWLQTHPMIIGIDIGLLLLGLITLYSSRVIYRRQQTPQTRKKRKKSVAAEASIDAPTVENQG